jgi:ABC-type nitrate/sulfonate/bicarbonate transport system substrate-binding protein
MALEKGFYQKHGIDLSILNGGPETSTSEYLHSGKRFSPCSGLPPPFVSERLE